MTLSDLAKFLPRGMPFPLPLRKGDKVFVRMSRCPHLLQVGYITRLRLEGVDQTGLTLEQGLRGFRIEIELENDLTFELVEGAGVIYTPSWVNLFAGSPIVEDPPPKGTGRLARLLGNS